MGLCSIKGYHMMNRIDNYLSKYDIKAPKGCTLEIESTKWRVLLCLESNGACVELSPFPANDTMLVISNVQDHSDKNFKQLLDAGEQLAKEFGYEFVIITTNDYFHQRDVLYGRKYSLQVEERNPHSENDISFYTKKL